MKASELRIGNIVAFDLWHHVVTAQDILDCENGLWEGKDIRPEPLTEDWLKRFGFVSRAPETPHAIWDCLKSDFNMIIFLSPPERTEYRTGATTGSAKCNTVHQLQNLYHALTGEELVIKP